MIEYADITNGRQIFEVPIAQFVLNEKQQIAIVGIDFDAHGGYKAFHKDREGVQGSHMGKLEDLSFIVQNHAVNSLHNVEWDFDRWPNPEVVLLTKIS